MYWYSACNDGFDPRLLPSEMHVMSDDVRRSRWCPSVVGRKSQFRADGHCLPHGSTYEAHLPSQYLCLKVLPRISLWQGRLGLAECAMLVSRWAYRDDHNLTAQEPRCHHS